MLSSLKSNKLELTEENFNRFLPDYLQRASRIYFTPIRIAQLAAEWLTEDGAKTVLDIGAGVGKFCVAGASTNSSFYFGIEYRKSVSQIANDMISRFQLSNSIVQHGNVVELDFQNFDAFYMYNPFFENLLSARRLNDEVELAGSLYSYYINQVRHKLDCAKPGTRLVTFHGNNFDAPESFKKIHETEGGLLKFWIRQ